MVTNVLRAFWCVVQNLLSTKCRVVNVTRDDTNVTESIIKAMKRIKKVSVESESWAVKHAGTRTRRSAYKITSGLWPCCGHEVYKLSYISQCGKRCSHISEVETPSGGSIFSRVIVVDLPACTSPLLGKYILACTTNAHTYSREYTTHISFPINDRFVFINSVFPINLMNTFLTLQLTRIIWVEVIYILQYYRIRRRKVEGIQTTTQQRHSCVTWTRLVGKNQNHVLESIVLVLMTFFCLQ